MVIPQANVAMKRSLASVSSRLSLYRRNRYPTYQTKAPRPAIDAIIARPDSNKMTERLVKHVLLSIKLPSE